MPRRRDLPEADWWNVPRYNFLGTLLSGCSGVHERALSPDLVRRIIREGEQIASYADDKPLPSVLILGFEARGNG
jgi:hypothetical protein